MDINVIAEKISAMSPTAFENLAFDIARAVGLRNLVWRTPGADGGRDIEGMFFFNDPSGYDRRETWHIECKRYSSSIDWPTIWGKVAFANSHNADVLLLFTNSNPSPGCENEISAWNNSQRFPKIRVWRGYDIPRLLRLNTDILLSHGLDNTIQNINRFSTEIALLLSKLIQTSYSSFIFNNLSITSLEAASCISELFTQRLFDVQQHGRFVHAEKLKACTDWPWLVIMGSTSDIEEIGFRGIVSFLRHVAQGDRISAKISVKTVELNIRSEIPSERWISAPGINTILHWALCDEIRIIDKDTAFFTMR